MTQLATQPAQDDLRDRIRARRALQEAGGTVSGPQIQPAPDLRARIAARRAARETPPQEIAQPASLMERIQQRRAIGTTEQPTAPPAPQAKAEPETIEAEGVRFYKHGPDWVSAKTVTMDTDKGAINFPTVLPGGKIAEPREAMNYWQTKDPLKIEQFRTREEAVGAAQRKHEEHQAILQRAQTAAPAGGEPAQPASLMERIQQRRAMRTTEQPAAPTTQRLAGRLPAEDEDAEGIQAELQQTGPTFRAEWAGIVKSRQQEREAFRAAPPAERTLLERGVPVTPENLALVRQGKVPPRPVKTEAELFPQVPTFGQWAYVAERAWLRAGDEEKQQIARAFLQYERDGQLDLPTERGPRPARENELKMLQEVQGLSAAERVHVERLARVYRVERTGTGVAREMGESLLYLGSRAINPFNLGDRFIPGLGDWAKHYVESQPSGEERVLAQATGEITKFGTEMKAIGALFRAVAWASPLAAEALAKMPGLRRVGPAVSKALRLAEFQERFPATAKLTANVLKQVAVSQPVAAAVTGLEAVGYNMSWEEAEKQWGKNAAFFGLVSAAYGAMPFAFSDVRQSARMEVWGKAMMKEAQAVHAGKGDIEHMSDLLKRSLKEMARGQPDLETKVAQVAAVIDKDLSAARGMAKEGGIPVTDAWRIVKAARVRAAGPPPPPEGTPEWWAWARAQAGAAKPATPSAPPAPAAAAPPVAKAAPVPAPTAPPAVPVTPVQPTPPAAAERAPIAHERALEANIPPAAAEVAPAKETVAETHLWASLDEAKEGDSLLPYRDDMTKNYDADVKELTDAMNAAFSRGDMVRWRYLSGAIGALEELAGIDDADFTRTLRAKGLLARAKAAAAAAAPVVPPTPPAAAEAALAKPAPAGAEGEVAVLKKSPDVFWHGSPSGDLRGGREGLHVGTYEAAKQALEARIGVPAEGEWDGTREYGKTLLAGKKTLRAKDPRGYLVTGVNVDAPEADYYPTGTGKYSDQTAVPMTAKPSIVPVRIKGEMVNTPATPKEDFKAGSLMAGQIKKGKAKRGYFYKNAGEDEGSISAVLPSQSHLEIIQTAAQAPTMPQVEKGGPGAQVAAEVAPEAKPEALAEAPPKHTVLGDFHAEESGAFRAKGAEEVVEATESALRQTFGQAKGLWRGIVDLPGNILRAVPAENPIGKLRDWVGPRVSVAFGRPAEWVESYFQAKGSTELAKLRVAKIAADMTGAFKKAGLDPNDAQTMLRIEAAVRGEVPMESLPPVGQEWAKTIRSAQDTESLYAAEIFDQVGLPEKAELYRKNVGKYLKHVPITDVSLTAKTRAFIGRLVGPRLSSAWGKRAKTRWDVYVGQEIVASFDPATDPQAEVKARAAYQEAVESTKVELATKRWQAKKWTLTRKGKVPVTKTVRVDGKPVRKFTGEFLDWMKTVEGAGPEAADLYRKAAGRVHLVEPISAQWRLEHEVHDPRYLLARGAVEARHDAEMARLFSVAAERWGQEAPTEMTEEEVAAWAEDGGLVQLPESGRLHDLKGMYVPKNIALDLTDMVRLPSTLGKLYQQYMGVWKEFKVIWNIPTHGRQAVCNLFVFPYLGRYSPLNPQNAKYWVQAPRELFSKGKAHENLVRFGAVGTEFWGAELHKLNDVVRTQGTGRLDTFMALQRACRDNMGAFYALSDQWCKMAGYLKYIDEGMSPQEASEEVNKWNPNSARISKLTRVLRQSPVGAPFVSFVDQSIRIAGRAVRDRPLRLLALIAAPGILSYLSALVLGLSDEEKEVADKQRGYFEPIVPFRGNRGQVMNLDLRYIMPLANDIVPEFRGDMFSLPWFMQSPMLRAGVEQMINKELFLGRPIVTEKMTAKEKLLARLGQVALTAAPYPSMVVYGPGRIGRSMDEDGRETLGLAILGSLSGINIRPAYVSEGDVREVVKNAWLEGEPELANTILRLWNDRYRPANKDRLVFSSIALGAISGWSQARTIALQEAAAMLSAGDEGGAKERLEVYNTTVLPEIRKKSPKARELDIPAARRFVSQVETKRAYKPLGAAENP